MILSTGRSCGVITIICDTCRVFHDRYGLSKQGIRKTMKQELGWGCIRDDGAYKDLCALCLTEHHHLKKAVKKFNQSYKVLDMKPSKEATT